MSQLLQASQQSHQLINQLKQLTGTGLFRYGLIVASSERKENCPYARIEARRATQDQQQTIQLLESMIQNLQETLDVYKTCPDVDSLDATAALEIG